MRCSIAIATVLAVSAPVAWGMAEESATANTNAARQIYETKCAKCHGLHDPRAYDDSAWDRWLSSMRRKARLTPSQYEQVSSYLRKIRHPEESSPAAKRETIK